MRYLLNRGLDVTTRAADGDTALMMAIAWGDTNTVALLFHKAPQALMETEDWPLVRIAGFLIEQGRRSDALRLAGTARKLAPENEQFSRLSSQLQ